MGTTYDDFLAERGYVPLCCDNNAQDLWTIFCCFGWLYPFLISFYCLALKAHLSTSESPTVLWIFSYAYAFMVIMIVFGIRAAQIAKVPAPVANAGGPVGANDVEGALGGY